MNYIATGTITKVNSEELFLILKNEIPDLRGRSRVFGYDIELENKELEFYINTYDEKMYQIDISSINLDKLLEIMNILKNTLIELDCEFDLGYRVEDENGNQISPDYSYFIKESNTPPEDV